MRFLIHFFFFLAGDAAVVGRGRVGALYDGRREPEEEKKLTFQNARSLQYKILYRRLRTFENVNFFFWFSQFKRMGGRVIVPNIKVIR